MQQSMQPGLIALLTGLFGLALVQAAEMPTRGPIPFEVFDLNADGLVSEQEFLQVHIKRQEIREAQGRRTRGIPDIRMFRYFDSDGDGKLNRDELAAGQLANRQGRLDMQYPALPPAEGRGLGMDRNLPKFSDFDGNQDGLLSEEEFNAGHNKRFSERARQGYMMRGLQYAEPFSEIDTNGDERVDPNEFASAQARHRQQRMPQ